MDEPKAIYLITMIEKRVPGDLDSMLLCCHRTVGYYFSFEDADEAVRKNRCDLSEGCYDYACIEKIEPGLYPIPSFRQMYKFSRETVGYVPIQTPWELSNYILPIGGIS